MPDLIDNDLLLVVGDFVDDVLHLALAHAQLVECRDAFIGNGNTNIRQEDMVSKRTPQWKQEQERDELSKQATYPDAS